MPKFELVYILISPAGEFTDTVFTNWSDLCDYLKEHERDFMSVRIDRALLAVVE